MGTQIGVALAVPDANPVFSALNMGEAFQSGFVPLALRVIRGFSTDEGLGVVIGLRGSSARSECGFSAAKGGTLPGSASSGLAALLGSFGAAKARQRGIYSKRGRNGSGTIAAFPLPLNAHQYRTGQPN